MQRLLCRRDRPESAALLSPLVSKSAQGPSDFACRHRIQRIKLKGVLLSRTARTRLCYSTWAISCPYPVTRRCTSCSLAYGLNRSLWVPSQISPQSKPATIVATPLPAALPLLAGGLGFVGYLVGRKKRAQLANGNGYSPTVPGVCRRLPGARGKAHRSKRQASSPDDGRGVGSRRQ
jgi:hypothetical protein